MQDLSHSNDLMLDVKAHKILNFFHEYISDENELAQLNEILFTHQGCDSQICCKVFNEGDLVYHCATCAYDESCVLCEDCFEDEQHRGHEVTFSQSSGNGGCCDCGDRESWKDPQIDSCKHRRRNGSEQEKIEVLPNLLLNLKSAILDLFKRIILALNLSESAECEQENAQWAVLLYNDEMHSFDQVISTVLSALEIEPSEAEEIAKSVDEIGRVCCFRSEFQEEAQQIAKAISKSKLFTRVITLERFERENFAFDLLNVLLRLARFHEIRILICNLFMSPFSSLFQNLQDDDDDSSLPEGLFSFQKPKIQDLLLIDYLLIYEHLGWKSFREHFNQFLIACPFAECETFKVAVSERFCFVYSCIYEIYQKEREPEISIINFSTQIFTGPKIALHLTLNTSIFKVLIGILRALFSGTLSNSSLTVNTQHRSLKNRRFYQLLNDFHHLISHQTVQEAFPPELKEPILQILSFFEGFSPETRAVNEHVQFENSSWIYAFNISLRIAPLIWHLSKCFSSSDIPLILQNYQNIPQISQRNNSFYHPFHWLLGAIIHRETVDHADSATTAITTIFAQFPQASKILIDHSLGLQFMIAEIQSNLWIRNGSSIYQQAYAYFGSDLYEFMWAQDWNLCKFIAQKTTLIPKIDFAFENASHLQEILVLICRLISQVDHNSPRTILLHVLAEGPVKLSELTERLPDCLKNHQKLFNSLLEELSMRKGKKFQLKPCFLPQIDVFHLAVKTKKHQTDIVHHCKDNSVDAYLNDVPSDSSGCVNLLSALQERIQTVSSDWIRECSNEICALAWRMRNQIPNFFDQLVPKLPQDSSTVQKVFSLSTMMAFEDSSQNSLLVQKREEKPKKKRALEFQQAILQQMQEAQKFYLESAEQDFTVQTSSKPSSPSESSSHKCMICQEELHSKPFGFWSKREKMNFSKFSSPLLSFTPQACKGYFYSTCGHCIHLDCNDSFTQFSNYLKSEIDPITGIEEEFQLYTCPVCKRIGNVVIPFLEEEEELDDPSLESSFRSFKGVLFEKNSSTMEDIVTSIRMQFIVAELLERIQGQGDYQFDQGPDSRILIPMIKYVEKNGISNVLQRLQEEFKNSPIYSMLFSRFIQQNQTFFPNFIPIIPSIDHSSFSIENQVQKAGFPFLMPLESRLDQMIARLSGLKCLNCSINHSDYAICLMCEQICCPKKLCCADGPFGECVQHRASQDCGFDTVAFFWPKKCKILVISKGCGSFYPAPYVDEMWGETFALGKRIIRHLDRPKYLGFCRKWLMGELANLGCVDGEAVPLGPDWYTF